jgi:hypothetical protein
MFSKVFCAGLLLIATSAFGQTIYRTVTSDGKIIYSDVPVVTEGSSKPIKTTSLSAEHLDSINLVDGDNRGTRQGNDTCAPDIRRYCSRTDGSSQTTSCLLDHQKDVSDACYESLRKQVGGTGQSAGNQTTDPNSNKGPSLANCKQDVQQYCKATKAGSGRIVDCLLDHQNDISDTCYESLARQLKSAKK